ncbi:MAG: site-specific DNA-methyltransferase [Candidatus Atribacteria bacterium]|nr:site-specific DNA-methyltransferase [Candidatus Atribacteria bacterium]
MEGILYATDLGNYYLGDSQKILTSYLSDSLKGKVQLILTSPPFPLNNKKSYGNLNGDDYKEWFISFAEIFSPLLKEDGSIVIELGNAWEPKRPVQSLLHLESLLGFVNNPKANLRLCQEFICYNPSRLPSPAQWVTIERIRVVDSFTHIWWMSKSDCPKSDNRRILRPYSKEMKNLLKSKKYNPGKRPSEHDIGQTSFFKDNNGSIAHNVIELEPIIEKKELRLPKNVISIANTNSNDFFLRKCRERNIKPHPARMPLELATFFIEFLTDPGDLVLDPFAGSNTTGYCAQYLGRKWLSIEIHKKYAEQAIFRFEDPSIEGDFYVYRK